MTESAKRFISAEVHFEAIRPSIICGDLYPTCIAALHGRTSWIDSVSPFQSMRASAAQSVQ